TRIAKETGIDRTTVNRHVNKPDNRKIIEAETQKYLEAIPDIIDQTKRDIATSNAISKVISGEHSMDALPKFFDKDKNFILRFLEQTYRKESDCLRATGILPTNAPSIFIQNLTQNNTTVISPNVLEALGSFMSKNMNEDEEDFIEVETVKG
ncbi:MAG: hypothetical protein KAT00_13770, partial [Planctomycetes bacterium]|nr:hypothetical protein [Planctomycetota bacterium]